MELLDYLVLLGYFLTMIGIGVWSSRRIKKQEDYFMGGRGFGKLLQTFAAFGAGTGSSDPVNTGRTTFLNGLSGMWSVMYWLFVTPFYWITSVWYRRMRHLTLGDWFVERYQSQALGLGYCIFGLLFFMVYGSMMFSAIGKIAPLMNTNVIMFGTTAVPIEYVFVPVIGIVVLIYGIAGGLEAAYFTDLIQGLAIVLLSIILIPFALQALVQQYATDPEAHSMFYGFTILHQRLPEEHFSIFGTSTSEFPWYRILAVVLINLVGIVVQPHFIATGGGSAKTEMNARVGLVVGNFLKRFCTIGWVLTALCALALYANNPVLNDDPDKTWGVAARELLPVGLRGLMLACLLAALMSSIDVYMVVGSSLVVRNIYAPYINSNASEKEYLRVGRITGGLIVAGAVIISLSIMDVFEQLQLTWVFGVLFAAPFWVGMYWRRATTTAAWVTVAYCAVMFFLIPFFAPRIMPGLRTNPAYSDTNELVVTYTRQKVAPSDKERQDAKIANWDAANKTYQETWKQFEKANSKLLEVMAIPSAAALKEYQKSFDAFFKAAKTKDKLGKRPQVLKVGEEREEVERSGGKSIFWTDGVQPVDEEGNPIEVGRTKVVREEKVDDKTRREYLDYPDGVRLQGKGNFLPDFLLYRWLGVSLVDKTNAMLDTLVLPPKIITPFLVMIVISLVTPANKKEGLDRYYIKMKTPVIPNPEEDQQALEQAYANPEAAEQKKLFPGSSLEFQRPSMTDIVGFVISFLVCFLIIGLALWVANIGS